MIFNVDICEDVRANDQRAKQMFHAKCRETGDEVLSHDPEHAICRKLVIGGAKNSSMQTYRGQTPSMLFADIEQAAKRSVAWSNASGWFEQDFRTAPVEWFREAAE